MCSDGPLPAKLGPFRYAGVLYYNQPPFEVANGRDAIEISRV